MQRNILKLWFGENLTGKCPLGCELPRPWVRVRAPGGEAGQQGRWQVGFTGRPPVTPGCLGIVGIASL